MAFPKGEAIFFVGEWMIADYVFEIYLCYFMATRN